MDSASLEFNDAIDAIKDEIDYANTQYNWDHQGTPTLESSIIQIILYSPKVAEAWNVGGGKARVAALGQIRKLAGICLKAMETSGVVRRCWNCTKNAVLIEDEDGSGNTVSRWVCNDCCADPSGPIIPARKRLKHKHKNVGKSKEVIEFLLTQKEPVPTLQIAKTVFGANATKATVNPILHSLKEKGEVRSIKGHRRHKGWSWEIDMGDR
jgi:hypothetical protein